MTHATTLPATLVLWDSGAAGDHPIKIFENGISGGQRRAWLGVGRLQISTPGLLWGLQHFCPFLERLEAQPEQGALVAFASPALLSNKVIQRCKVALRPQLIREYLGYATLSGGGPLSRNPEEC